MLAERLEILGARPNPGLRRYPSDASWHVQAFAIDPELAAEVVRARIRRRIYLYRYLPACPPSFWDGLRSHELDTYVELTSDLVKRENG